MRPYSRTLLAFVGGSPSGSGTRVDAWRKEHVGEEGATTYERDDVVRDGRRYVVGEGRARPVHRGRLRPRKKKGDFSLTHLHVGLTTSYNGSNGITNGNGIEEMRNYNQ
jgi:hypothetical protein